MRVELRASLMEVTVSKNRSHAMLGFAYEGRSELIVVPVEIPIAKEAAQYLFEEMDVTISTPDEEENGWLEDTAVASVGDLSTPVMGHGDWAALRMCATGKWAEWAKSDPFGHLVRLGYIEVQVTNSGHAALDKHRQSLEEQDK